MLKIIRYCSQTRDNTLGQYLNKFLHSINSDQLSTLYMVKLKSSSKSGQKQSKRHQSSIKPFKSLKSSSSNSLKSISSSTSHRMKVHPIKALQDNYMYLLVDEATRHAAAVDPVNASAMASAVADHGVDLKAILTTHHHYDHANGNSDMLSMFPELVVYGGDYRVQGLTKIVAHGDVIKLGTLNIECLATPCHTRGHICYYVTADTIDQPAAATTTTSETSEKVVFTGDTLFIAGCGRFFEGSSDQMIQNLNVILGNLPPDTKVYCGHEYTVTNLKFALSVEPHNVDIKNKLDWASNKVAKREPTVPSTIGEEKKINPFMRLHVNHVKKFTGETDEIEVMTVLRHKKNEFVP
jgi:hydroxyacylglutathione hydrolase